MVKILKNIPKSEHELLKITNVEKPTKMGTKMPKNLPKWGPKLPKTHNCAIKTAEKSVKCAQNSLKNLMWV